MSNNPSPKGPSDAELAASIENCIQLMEDGMAVDDSYMALRFLREKAAEIALRISDEGNNYFAATGAEHSRELRGNFQLGAKNGK